MRKNNNKKIYVAGHLGMVGSSIIRALKSKGFNNIILRSKKDLDLVNQLAVNRFFKKERPQEVYLAAAKVGGIFANNKFPAEFIYQNVMMQTNIINAAFENGVKKILFLGSSCIYPKFSKQPILEEYLLTGKLEPTNEPYAIAKIVGIKMCESYNRQYGKSHGVDYRCVMPTNLYGKGDNYHPVNSHVIPALIRRFHEAKINNKKNVLVWGTGLPKREFLYVDDLADACIHVMNISKKKYKSLTDEMCSHINIGSGKDVTIKKLAETIKEVVGFEGNINFNTKMPNGIPRKLLDSSRITKLKWKPKVNLFKGLKVTYKSFLKSL
ncbi:GDP-L-fucose synthase family protein [Candidatus Pelagibacter sp. HIMB1593]|uniref:GDP-L-fucose synthase family protein n=1 Tax=Candidatus Pelagibacter sp. HIMB1593 TaxID=3413355 RepID=UPI003F8412FE